MFLKFLKASVFAVGILLLGQVRVSQSTLGGMVEAQLQQALSAALAEAKRSSLFAKLGTLQPFWKLPTRSASAVATEEETDEPLTPEDQQDLGKLLE